MYDRYIRQVKDDAYWFKSLEEVVSYLETYIESLLSMRVRVLRDIQHYKEDAGYLAIGDVRAEAISILEREARNAIGRRKEFNTVGFWQGLSEAIRDPEIYRFSISSGSGNLVVRIDLDRSAGTLRDYAKGIEQARTRLGVKQNNPMASYFWKEKYYMPAREGKDIPQPKPDPDSNKKKKTREYDVAKYIAAYWKTIRLRRSLSRKKAPWWRILNYGTTSLDSDKGGEPYPENAPTRFLERAIKEMKDVYNMNYRVYQRMLLDLKEELIQIDRAIRFCEYAVARISRKVSSGGANRSHTPTVNEIRDFAFAQIRKQVGENWGYVDYTRVIILLDSLISGKDLGQEKFRLSPTGSENYVRARYVQLRQDVEEFRNRSR